MSTLPTLPKVTRGDLSLVQGPSYAEGSQSPRKTQKPNTGDSISSTTSKDGCLAKFWKAICNFFKCICPCLFGRKAQEPSSQNTKQSTKTNSSNIQSAPVQMSSQTPESTPKEPLENIQSAPTQINKTTTEPSALETAQTQFLMWWNELSEDGETFKNRVGGKLKDADWAEKLQDAAQASGFPPQNITLYCQHYYHGFSFFYAMDHGTGEYLPIDRGVGYLLRVAQSKNVALLWTTTHPRTGKQVVVQVGRFELLEPWPSGSGKTGELLQRWLNKARGDHNQSKLHLLEALIPYAHSVKEQIGDSEYAQLRTLIPAYPENPSESSNLLTR